MGSVRGKEWATGAVNELSVTFGDEDDWNEALEEYEFEGDE